MDPNIQSPENPDFAKLQTKPAPKSPAMSIDQRFAGKIKKRCQYWPNCKNAYCPFIHPEENCPAFPKCTWGEQCFFIHPSIPCRFGSNCSRSNCAYTHPEGKATPSRKTKPKPKFPPGGGFMPPMGFGMPPGPPMDPYGMFYGPPMGGFGMPPPKFGVPGKFSGYKGGGGGYGRKH